MTIQNLKSNDGTNISLDSAVIDGFRGEILTPSDQTYESVRAIWNATVERRPAMIARCTGAADVVAAVKFAAKHNVLTSVRGGGHNIAGSAPTDGGLPIDLSNMRGVDFDPVQKMVRVQGGALLADVDHETQAFGLAVPFGINSTTGVAGLTLGGGFGWMSRAFAHAADNLLSADIVTADGIYRRISDTQEPDLFWAIRGGGGNFGVVTSFEFRCHPIGPMITAGPVIHLLEDARDVYRKYREVAAALPDEATCWTVMRKAPPFPFLDEKHHGKPVLILAMAYIGDADKAEAALAPLRDIGTPIGDAVGQVPYVAWQAAFDPLLEPGVRNYWKSQDYVELTDDVIDVMLAAVANLPSDHCEVFIAQLGGAGSRVPPDQIAFPHRSHNYTMNIHGRWDDKADDVTCIGWVRDLFKKTEPHATGSVYVNFMPEEEKDRKIGPYGANRQRLEAIKAKYDPNNRFQTNINISPKAD
ncbi:MAG: FAD-binding oxidoreductase [Paracoccaceae bacterium]